MRRRKIAEDVHMSRAYEDSDVDVTVHVEGEYRPSSGPSFGSGGEPAEWPDAEVVAVEGEHGAIDVASVPATVIGRWMDAAVEIAIERTERPDR